MSLAAMKLAVEVRPPEATLNPSAVPTTVEPSPTASAADRERNAADDARETSDTPALDFRHAEIHFGKNRGLTLAELTPQQTHWYETEWMPNAVAVRNSQSLLSPDHFSRYCETSHTMKVEFLQPRFEGERFEQHTLPVEVARDLAAYEELIIALARHLYLEAHPGRQRVPKGFEESFSLHLEHVESGSARLLLTWVTALALGTLPFPPGGDGSGAAQTFFQARDLIAECIDASAAGQPLPPRFPRELLDYFNVLGRSLREGESVDLHPDHTTGAKLIPERRKRLVLAGQQYYTREVHYAGTVAELDWEKGTFRLRLTDNAAVVAPLPDFFRERAVSAGGKARSLTQIRCIGQFDALDHLQKIVETLQLEVSANHALAAQFEKLGTVTDGWLEGAGKAIDPELLAWTSDRVLETFPEDLPVVTKWPYLPETADDFESTAQRLVALVGPAG